MSFLSDLKRALDRFGELEQPRAERLPAPGLGALYGVKNATEPAWVKDISSSGVYLSTEKRIHTGESVSVVFREQGEAQASEDLQFCVDARVTRHGEDGVGLSFILPPGLNLDLWGVLVRNMVSLQEPEHVAEMFHALRTTLFLCRICGAGAEDPIHLLGGVLDKHHTQTLVQVAAAAERLLHAEPDADRLHADPKLIARILREGSWALDDLNVQLWAGLLVASCSVNAPDASNEIFVDLLVHLTPTEAKILVHACERALRAEPETSAAAPAPITLNRRQLIEITGIYDINRNTTDLAYLFNLGLIRHVFDFTSYHETDTFDITPSPLGLVLYRRCHGDRGAIDPEIVESTTRHLANFIPEPQPFVFDLSAPPASVVPVGGR